MKTAATRPALYGFVPPLAAAPAAVEQPRVPTEHALLDAIASRFCLPRYVFARHVPRDLGRSGRVLRTIDGLAIGQHAEAIASGRAHLVLGFEVKRTRGDWLRELAEPAKMRAWSQHCHRVYIVTPAAADVVHADELGGCGHIAVDKHGRTRIRSAAVDTAAPKPLLPVDAARLVRSAFLEGTRGAQQP